VRLDNLLRMGGVWNRGSFMRGLWFYFVFEVSTLFESSFDIYICAHILFRNAWRFPRPESQFLRVSVEFLPSITHTFLLYLAR
jgi:hypothetical protein